MTDLYLTPDDLKFALGHPDAEDEDPLLLQAIQAASRQIDEWAGGRQFWAGSAPSARLFYPENRYLVRVGYYSTKTGVIVKTDEAGDGVFETTWTTAQWRAHPAEPINGRPYEWIIASTPSRLFPVNGRSPCVEVTASWGWASVPGPVKQACQILSLIYYRSKEFTGGDIGFGTNIESNNMSSPYGIAFRLIRDLVGEMTSPTRGPTNNLVESLANER